MVNRHANSEIYIHVERIFGIFGIFIYGDID